MAKTCAVCGETKGRCDFSRSHEASDGLRSVCKKCGRKAKRKEYADIPEEGIPAEKLCSKCGITKSHKEFQRTGRGSGKSALQPCCRDCARIRQRAWYDKNKENESSARKRYYYNRHYGLTPEALDELKASSDGRCAICGAEEKLAVDHDHVTGKVRGLLCHNCNLGLGNFKDNVDILREAIEYLCRSRSK